MSEMLTVDREWGLFRPAYWAYPPFVYGSSAALGHVIRLAMLSVALVGPLVALRREGASTVTLSMAGMLLVGGSYWLDQGLFFLSLQELSGAAFIGLGLIFRRTGPRLLMWTIAAWFKAPFAWILIGEGLALWRRGERRAAIVSLAVGSGTLALATLMARNGSYTSNYALDVAAIYRMVGNADKLIEIWTGIILVSLVWWLIATGTPLRPRSDTFVFGFAWLWYTLQMLPWGVTGHYMGAINYLLALFLASLLVNPLGLSRRRNLVALFVPTVIAGGILFTVVHQGLALNATLIGLRDCLVSQGSVRAVAPAGFGSEGVVRLEQITVLQHPSWSGSIRLIGPDGALPDDPTPNLFIGLYGEQPPRDMQPALVCTVPGAQVFRLE
jgi:hypothetical protein